ncbi:hypothetical protein N5853_02475 [Bartonella sp. HY329]|uniref:hypothetical protein n=1 Tax=unclassified Bartonella TaxID=2645622 RepID=UPI0021C68374|nr:MULTISPECIES: hypothetical protein [unclassified Bartonella]UXM95524.1 hypothetical protein N5853_02475 [Bartonella sp. HY329]UXN09849.1 hypothetical protein N5852_02485 [Bartonella sp. HY328]
MFEALTFTGFAQQVLAALVVFLFAGATILRIYLICPLHTSLKEYFADSADDEGNTVDYSHSNVLENGICER